MPIPSYETLMLPVLKLGNQGVVSFKEAVAKLSDDFNLTDEERDETIPSGPEPLIKNRTGWAITYLVKAKLLQRPKRAHFTITDRGKECLAKNPVSISRKDLEQYPEIIEFLHKKKKSSPEKPTPDDLVSTPEERIAYNNRLLMDFLRSDNSQYQYELGLVDDSFWVGSRDRTKDRLRKTSNGDR